MAEEEERNVYIEDITLLDISRDYIAKIFDAEQRKKEIEINKAEVEDRTKALEALMQKGSVEVLKDLERLPQVIQEMKIFNKKIDEAEEQILVTSIRQNETKKSLHETKKIKERVKESLAGIDKIEKIIENTEYLERISNKTMIQIDKIISQRKRLPEDDVHAIFLWVSAYKKLGVLSKQFTDYSFYTAMCLTLEQSEKRLIVTANLMAQWWICEVSTGIVQLGEQKEQKKKEGGDMTVSEEIKEIRKFALSNRDFVLVSKYIYEELDRAEEFTEYINNARRRELIKLCKLQVDKYSIDRRLGVCIDIFLEFFSVDREIKSFISQNIDPAVEEYDRAIQKKLESIINSIPLEQTDDHYVFKKIKLFFLSIQKEKDTHFKNISEILIQSTYKCIDSECNVSKQKIKSIKEEKKPVKEVLFAVASEIRKFFRESKNMIYEVEQIENELDDIILKCTNSLVCLISGVLENSSPEEALQAQGFAADLKDSIRKELEDHSHSISEESLLSKIPEIKKISEAETKIVQRTQEELKKKLDSISSQIVNSLKRITAESSITLYPTKVSDVLEAYKEKVPISFLQKELDTILEFTLECLPQLKVYKQVDSVENDFAVLYKSVQYLNLETENTKNILKMFTEIDCLRKNLKKSASDAIGTDLDSLLAKYSKKKDRIR
ncbi:hypothetical protein NEMIN01_1997 [Nematocida minor]|uniref:uncharacterized protein n=1 Tax=Nematocida minor TaxID=1912983 RepID=UPI0022204217|nr:uncharacterized protein NEMIN01_1997 [Nematocida minor]KAI5192410.1 hypothetical protein NEMIN01_1997 [Nematocida minor]